MNRHRKTSNRIVRTAHPSAAELMDHAENLCNQHGTLSASVGGHVAGCEKCRIEVDRICGTLGVVQEVEGLDPSREFRAGLLLAARSQMQESSVMLPVYIRLPRYIRTFSVAACLLVASGLAFWTYGNTPELTISQDGTKEMNASLFTLESLRAPSPEEKLLTEAVMSSMRRPVSAWDKAQQRAIRTLGEDIAEALAALERNPACRRASELVSTNRQHLKTALKTFYMERSL